jgi:hypothetical protein
MIMASARRTSAAHHVPDLVPHLRADRVSARTVFFTLIRVPLDYILLSGSMVSSMTEVRVVLMMIDRCHSRAYDLFTGSVASRDTPESFFLIIEDLFLSRLWGSVGGGAHVCCDPIHGRSVFMEELRIASRKGRSGTALQSTKKWETCNSWRVFQLIMPVIIRKFSVMSKRWILCPPFQHVFVRA